MEYIKLVHMGCAFLSISGFILRGIWMIQKNALLSHRLTKTLPHVIDTVLLGAAITMAYIYGFNPFYHSWLLAKIIALLVYIGLGFIVFRLGKTQQQRIVAWILAIVVFSYIAATALLKNSFLGLG